MPEFPAPTPFNSKLIHRTLHHEFVEIWNSETKRFSGPLPSWLLHPKLANLSSLKELEGMYTAGKIDRTVYDEWMDTNSFAYMRVNDQRVMSLWNERYLPIKEQISEPFYAESKGYGYRIGKCKSRKTTHPHEHVFIASKKLNRHALSGLNDIFPFGGTDDKIHTNLDLVSLVLKCVVAGELDSVNKALSLIPLGVTNAMATMFIIQAIGNMYFSVMYDLIVSDVVCHLNTVNMSKYLKAVGDAVRRTRRIPGGPGLDLNAVGALTYWHLSTGRQCSVANWAEEKRKRTEVEIPLKPVVDVDFEALVEFELDGIMTELVRPSDKWTSWEEFIRNRQRWVSSGSAPGAYIVDDRGKIRLAKPAHFDNLETREMLGWLDSPPRIVASASNKNEMGKGRAIYGTHPKDYVIMSYVIASIEKHLDRIDGVESGASGFDDLANQVRRLRDSLNAKREMAMLDYDDFNFQHTRKIQSAVFKALGKVLVRYGAHEDVIKACKWCELAFMDMRCRFPGDKESVQVIQGLFSGVRGTNFINTILNVAYYRASRTIVKEYGELLPVGEYNVHQGDDVWISNDSRLYNIVVYNVLLAANLKMNASKQLFAQAYGEFLRVTYELGKSVGYISRAIATLIIKPLQQTTLISPYEKAVGINSQIQLLYRRGLSQKACCILWWATIPYALKVLNSKPEIYIPLNVARRSFLDGGLDLGHPGSWAVRSDSNPPIPTQQIRDPKLEKSVGSHMAHEWVCLLSETLRTHFRSASVEKALHSINVAGSAPAIVRASTLRSLESKIRSWIDINNLRHVPNPRSDIDILQALQQLPSGHRKAKILLESISGPILSRKGGYKFSTQISDLFSSIASSPFRDLPTAKLALALNTIDAALVCIATSAMTARGQNSMLLLQRLRAQLGEPILERLLDGVRISSPGLESVFHPTILSVISKLALETAVGSCYQFPISSVDQWDDLLIETTLCVLHEFSKSNILLQLSRH